MKCPLRRASRSAINAWRAVEKDDADVAPSMHQDVAIGALQRGAGDHGALAGLADPVDLVGNRLQPGPAILVGQRLAGAHLGDIAGGVKPVAILVAPADPLRPAFRRWCFCPSRKRPSRPARTAFRSGVSHENSPEARPHRPARSSRRWSARGRPAGSRHRARASRSRACPTPATSNSISRQEASAGKVSVTRGTNGSTCALRHADHPALGFLQRRIIRETARRCGRRARRPSARDRTTAGRVQPVRAIERFQLALVALGAFVGTCGIGRDRMDVGRRRAAIQKGCRAPSPCCCGGSPAGTKRSSPMNQCTRSHGILAAIGLGRRAIHRAASGSTRRSGKSRCGRYSRPSLPARGRRRLLRAPPDRRP